MSAKIRVDLSFPVVFNDLNKKLGLDPEHETKYIEIQRMKYSHLKKLQKIQPQEQTDWAIRELTGLSDNDIEELYAEDAAEVTKIIFSFMEKYFNLAQKALAQQVQTQE